MCRVGFIGEPQKVENRTKKKNIKKSKVQGWSMWFTKILDLVSSFSKVHRWSLWFALCNTFSPQPTNLQVRV
ncbi:hypothetical protein Hanom_Chr02g00158361 [Helianthus anomalus]